MTQDQDDQAGRIHRLRDVMRKFEPHSPEWELTRDWIIRESLGGDPEAYRRWLDEEWRDDLAGMYAEPVVVRETAEEAEIAHPPVCEHCAQPIVYMEADYPGDDDGIWDSWHHMGTGEEACITPHP